MHEAEVATGLNVQLVNDGNAACWAEFVAHASPRTGNFAFLLIDTFVVRTLVVPAFAALIGPRLWWPAKLERA